VSLQWFGTSSLGGTWHLTNTAPTSTQKFPNGNCGHFQFPPMT